MTSFMSHFEFFSCFFHCLPIIDVCRRHKNKCNFYFSLPSFCETSSEFTKCKNFQTQKFHQSFTLVLNLRNKKINRFHATTFCTHATSTFISKLIPTKSGLSKLSTNCNHRPMGLTHQALFHRRNVLGLLYVLRMAVKKEGYGVQNS